MSAGFLTSLALVKQWLNLQPGDTAADAMLTTLIRNASAFVLTYCNREGFGKTLFNETYDGYGGPQRFLQLRQPRVISVSAVSLCGRVIAQAVGNGINEPYRQGFSQDRQRVLLHGECFPNGRSTVYVSYYAGYFKQSEPHVVSASSDPTLTVLTDEFWLSDESVTLEDGTALTKVTGTPGALQYKIVDGVYTFNAAQTDETVLISYSYCPADLVGIVTEMVGERYKYKDRIGYQSKSLGGQETVTFSTNNIPPYLKEGLGPFRRVIP